MFYKIRSNNGSYELIDEISNIPNDIDLLSFKQRALDVYDYRQLSQLFSLIGPRIKKLNLALTHLDKIDNVEYAIANIPKTVTSINLSINKLALLKGGGFIELVGLIKDTVTELNISQSWLNGMTFDSLVTLFKALPHCLKYLEVSGHEVSYGLTSEQLKALFSQLPNHLETIILKHFCGHLYDGDEVAGFFNVLPETLTRMDLSHFSLSYKSEDEIVSIMSALPKSLKSLCWEGMGLYDVYNRDISIDALRALKGALPNIKTLYLNYFECYWLKEDCKRALMGIFPNLKQLNLMDNVGIVKGKTLSSRINLAKELGFKLPIPSLSSFCKFFINKQKEIKVDGAMIPVEIKEYLHSK
jgi:hypothetical protein